MTKPWAQGETEQVENKFKQGRKKGRKRRKSNDNKKNTNSKVPKLISCCLLRDRTTQPHSNIATQYTTTTEKGTDHSNVYSPRAPPMDKTADLLSCQP